MGLHDHEDIEHVLGVPEDEQLIDEAPPSAPQRRQRDCATST